MIDQKLIADLEAALDAFFAEYSKIEQTPELAPLDAAYLSLVSSVRRVAVLAKGKIAVAIKTTTSPKYSGDACPNCGQFMLVMSGTCKTCQSCSWNTGCG